MVTTAFTWLKRASEQGEKKMGEQRNLTEENVDELRKQLDRMKKENPDLEYRFFKQKEKMESDQVSMDSIYYKIEDLEKKIDSIFDGHVIINGEFKKFFSLADQQFNPTDAG